jgi:hypothetical protein
VQAGFEMFILFFTVILFDTKYCAQIRTLKEVDSLKDVTVRFGSVAMAHSESHAQPTDYGNLALVSVVFLHYFDESDARNGFFQDETHG